MAGYKVWKSSGQWCSAFGCINNRRNNQELSFFRFPTQHERSRRWVVNSRREDLLKPRLNEKTLLDVTKRLVKNNVLCADHFEDSQYYDPFSKIRIRRDAVPTLFKHIPNPQNPIKHCGV